MNVYYTIADRTGFRTVPGDEFSQELRTKYNRVIFKDPSGGLEIRVSSRDIVWLLRMFLVSAVSDRIREVKERGESDE